MFLRAATLKTALALDTISKSRLRYSTAKTLGEQSKRIYMKNKTTVCELQNTLHPLQHDLHHKIKSLIAIKARHKAHYPILQQVVNVEAKQDFAWIRRFNSGARSHGPLNVHTYIHTYVFNCRDFYNTPVELSFLLHHNMIGERIVFNTLFNAGAINAKVVCNLLLEAFA